MKYKNKMNVIWQSAGWNALLMQFNNWKNKWNIINTSVLTLLFTQIFPIWQFFVYELFALERYEPWQKCARSYKFKLFAKFELITTAVQEPFM